MLYVAFYVNSEICKYIIAELALLAVLYLLESTRRADTNVGGASSRLESFLQGQVYNLSDALQVHVIPAPSNASEAKFDHDKYVRTVWAMGRLHRGHSVTHGAHLGHVTR